MLSIELFQHSMTPLLHHSMFSFNHPIRPRQNVGRNRQADLLSGLEVHDQLKLIDRLDRRSCGWAPVMIF
jgi:hypothetical protein